VLRACGVDPERWSGFAIGMGLDRTLMVRHDITDIRDLYEGDQRFTLALGTEA
jgi:phenylalanyl-tRNA synthetase alpha chain